MSTVLEADETTKPKFETQPKPHDKTEPAVASFAWLPNKGVVMTE